MMQPRNFVISLLLIVISFMWIFVPHIIFELNGHSNFDGLFQQLKKSFKRMREFLKELLSKFRILPPKAIINFITSNRRFLIYMHCVEISFQQRIYIQCYYYHAGKYK